MAALTEPETRRVAAGRDERVDAYAVDGHAGARDMAVPDDTSSKLVRAAAEVFAERGYDKAGVAEIARRAGLTTGAIYSRFAGKAELLAEAIRTYTSDEFDRLFAQHQFQGRATDLLATVGAHLVRRHGTAGQSILLEAFVAARRDPEVAAVLRRHLAQRAERLAGMIDESKETGMVDPAVDTAAAVHFAHAVGLGFLLFEAVDAAHPAEEAWQDVIQRAVAAFTPADAPAGPPPPHAPDRGADEAAGRTSGPVERTVQAAGTPGRRSGEASSKES